MSRPKTSALGLRHPVSRAVNSRPIINSNLGRAGKSTKISENLGWSTKMKRNWKEIEKKWLVECFYCLWNASIACRMCLLHAGCFYCLWNVSIACGMCLSLISLRDSRQYTSFQLSHPFHLVHTERKWKENERKWKGNERKWKEVDGRKLKGKWQEGERKWKNEEKKKKEKNNEK